MKVPTRKSAIILGLALFLALCVNSVSAKQPTTIPAWYNGQTVYLIPGVSGNVVGVDKSAIANHVANPLYVLNDQPSPNHVLGVAGTGTAGYNPYWDIVYVTVLDGRDLSTDPFTSEAEILDAYVNGEVDLNDTGFILLCQEVSSSS